MRRVLITGGAGFVGHHLVEHIVKNTSWEVVILDKMTYAAHGLNRLRHNNTLTSPKVNVLTYDLSVPFSPGICQEIGDVDYILHLGAESHVDNSIKNPEIFVSSNVLGTLNVLNFAKNVKSLKCFLYFSTDEVYGPAPGEVAYRESDRLLPANPYAATKASGEMLVHAYANTFQLPCIITRCMNIFGERQDAEKFIPICINKLRSGEPITIHCGADGKTSGRRGWIHARNVSSAILSLLHHSKHSFEPNGIVFNIPGQIELGNDEIATLIARILSCKMAELNYVALDVDRPGHDLRYGLNGDKIKSLGWKPPIEFLECFESTILWMVRPENHQWLL
jgi:dTDP-glucose 4,6-dehydratase